MKIALIALTSAALFGYAQPGFAQQKMDQDQSNHMDRSNNGLGMHSQFQNEDETGTSGQGNSWSDRDNWRDQQNAREDSEDQDSGRMHHWRMHGNMQGGMTPPWRMRGRMAQANEAAHFRFRRGPAVVDVQCPEGESLQTCVNAAGQLLEKIASLRGSAQGNTTGMGSGNNTGLSINPQSGSSLSNQPSNPPSSDSNSSGQ
jgi:hypothetical protein